jgi:hypothetical protein
LEVLQLDLDTANKFAALPLAGIVREYPNAPGILLNGPEDLRPPRDLHPAFYGCYDWHSAVHGFWSLARLMRLFPLERAEEVRSIFNSHLTDDNIQREIEYFNQPNRKTFERPYGWGWLLKLALELKVWQDAGSQRWSRVLKPLEDLIVERFLEFLPKQTYPIQNGVHTNTAFGMLLALEYAEVSELPEVSYVIRSRAFDYFEEPQLTAEPNGADFLSPSLTMAALMAKVLSPVDFDIWLGRLFPNGIPDKLRTPVHVSDRTDPQIGHLDGLNLSRAWCYRRIASAIDAEKFESLASDHLKFAQVATGDYGGEHWLATFAILALTDG